MSMEKNCKREKKHDSSVVDALGYRLVKCNFSYLAVGLLFFKFYSHVFSFLTDGHCENISVNFQQSREYHLWVTKIADVLLKYHIFFSKMQFWSKI